MGLPCALFSYYHCFLFAHFDFTSTKEHDLCIKISFKFKVEFIRIKPKIETRAWWGYFSRINCCSTCQCLLVDWASFPPAPPLSVLASLFIEILVEVMQSSSVATSSILPWVVSISHILNYIFLGEMQIVWVIWPRIKCKAAGKRTSSFEGNWSTEVSSF